MAAHPQSTIFDSSDSVMRMASPLHAPFVQLEFFPFAGLLPEQSSFMCSVRVDDVDALYRAIRASGVAEGSIGAPRLTPVRMQPWGLRAGALIDLDGTLLHLIENAV